MLLTRLLVTMLFIACMYEGMSFALWLMNYPNDLTVILGGLLCVAIPFATGKSVIWLWNLNKVDSDKTDGEKKNEK